MSRTRVPASIIEPLARAVAADRATALAGVLARLGAADAFDDDAYFAPPSPARYSRVPLWRDPAGHFAIVCMTWLPGQGTPVHDHAGRWGAELVVRGVMDETPYRCTARALDGRVRLAATGATALRARDVGVVLPTVDLHAFRNGGNEVARTVHVYSTLRDACTTYAAGDDGWWSGARIELGFDG